MNKLTHAASPWKSLHGHRRWSDRISQRRREENAIPRRNSWSALVEIALGKLFSAAKLSLQFFAVLLWVVCDWMIKATLVVGGVAAVPFLLFLVVVAFSLVIQTVGTVLSAIF